MGVIINYSEWTLLALRKMGAGSSISEIERFSLEKTGISLRAQPALVNLEQQDLVEHRLQNNPSDKTAPSKLVWELTIVGAEKADGLARMFREIL